MCICTTSIISLLGWVKKIILFFSVYALKTWLLDTSQILPTSISLNIILVGRFSAFLVFAYFSQEKFIF